MNDNDTERPVRQEVTELESGQMLHHHPRSVCSGACCLHGTAVDAVCLLPRSWRSDITIIEHHCPHGIGHPCPGSIYATHGCDGCCAEEP